MRGDCLEPIGIYVHVPFCAGKCPYCDFYSLRGGEAEYDAYTARAEGILRAGWGRAADTLYFGGGTPSLLGAGRLLRLVRAAKAGAALPDGAEITVEVNPSQDCAALLEALAAGGVTRVSIGMQSASEEELRALGRRHTADQALEAARRAVALGLETSLDLMVATPGQSWESLRRSAAACVETGARHLSAYLLKLEPGTAFAKDPPALPDEDEAADWYLRLGGFLESAGLRQYEISNFAAPGHEGRHNLKYWRCEEYAGVGPAAHSFLGGRRFYQPRGLRRFLDGGAPVDDGEGGGREEFAMLALRLREGLTAERWRRRFGEPSLPEAWLRRARKFVAPGWVECGLGFLRLTPRGFLLSNALMAEIFC